MAPKKMDTTRLHDIFMHDTPPSKAILSLMPTVNIVSFLKLLNMGFYKSKQLNKDDYSDVVLANWDLITEHRVLFLGGHSFIGDKVMLKLQGNEEGDSISIMIKDFAGTMHEMNVHPGQVLDLKALNDLYMLLEVLESEAPQGLEVEATNPHEIDVQSDAKIETNSIVESGGDEEQQVEKKKNKKNKKNQKKIEA